MTMIRPAPRTVTRREFLGTAAGATAAGGVLTLSAACGSSGGGTANGSAYRGQIAVTHLTNITEVAPYHVAQGLGYFEDSGLNLELVSFSGGTDTIHGMTSGMGFGTPATTAGLIAFANGAPLRLISGFYNAISVVFLVPSDSPLQSGADLRGAKIAVSRPGSNTDYIAARVLEQEGLRRDEDAEIVFVGGPPDAWTSTEQGLTDVAWSAPPVSEQLISSGKARLLFRADEYVRVTSVSNWVTEPFMQENAEVVRTWVQTMQRAFDAIRDDTDTAADAYARAVDIDPALAQRALEATSGDFDTAIDRTGVENALSAAVVLGHIDSVEDVDLGAVVVRDFVGK